MHATIDHFSGSAFVPDARQLKRVAAGVAISLALHALVLSIYRQPQPAPPAAAPEPLTVRLRPIAPQESPQTRPQARPAPAKRARPVIAVPAQTRESGDETHTVAPAPDAPPQQDAAPTTAPSFDMNAARGMARKLANEPDPAKVGTALERLLPKPLETESRLARGIGAAKRANCKDGIPGGLLAPIYLMLEKKDSGCKW
jgi:hypothetical protein